MPIAHFLKRPPQVNLPLTIMVLSEPVVFTTTFEIYTATEIIGEGGSARVFKATDEGGQSYALKLLDPSKATKEKVKRFKNEYLFCANNRHPNVVTVVDHGVFIDYGNTSPFVVMPYYGGSLRTLLQRGISSEKALHYFSQLLDGVECAHLQNVVHRDLKPENVLYDTETDRLLLSDFGIARFAEDELFTAVQTKDSTRLANFQYAAPEQRRRGAEVDRRADIYSLGLILNEMFTGEVPYGTAYQTIGAVAHEEAYLDDIVSQMIRQSPQDRPSDVKEVKNLLIGHKNDFITNQRISELTHTVVPVDELDDPLIVDPPHLVGLDWGNDQLTLTLSRPVNEKWNWALHNMGSHSSLVGYGPERFSFVGDKATIQAPERLVQRIIDYLKSWLPQTNQVYRERIEREKRQAEESQRKRLQQELESQQARQRVLRNVII
jgi:serine/threonine protein kinase